VTPARLLPLLLALFLTACASTPRFRDQPIVWQVEDARPIAEPEEREFLLHVYFADIFAFRRIPRALELRTAEPAANTNALDELPNSTWFTNRIGLCPLTPDEILDGPNQHGPPLLPLTVVRGKGAGANPGFFAEDRRGFTYLIKFDTHENPEMQTGTDVIVSRIFWALGYNVPSDHIVYFTREDLRLAPGAKIKDEIGHKRPMTETDVEATLSTAPVSAEGIYRALASEFLLGKPKGGIAPESTRPDDPNDVVPHELRRELRGLRVFCAWLGHTDMKEDNTLDMFIESADGKGYLRHYLIDFGEALGAHQAEKGRYEDGWEHAWDWQNQPKALLALGLWKRPWEGQRETPWPAIGAFGADQFDPKLWRSAFPYFPLFDMDAADAYWGAKHVLAFDRSLLEAIVAAGDFSAPEASLYLVDTLLERARRIGVTWLEAVTPLDRFSIENNQLSAVDLGVYHHLADQGTVETLDSSGRVISTHTVEKDGTATIPLSAEPGYHILRCRVRRHETAKPSMQIHYVTEEGTSRIVGVLRCE
jgi:hypothetical protein